MSTAEPRSGPLTTLKAERHVELPGWPSNRPCSDATYRQSACRTRSTSHTILADSCASRGPLCPVASCSPAIVRGRICGPFVILLLESHATILVFPRLIRWRAKIESRRAGQPVQDCRQFWLRSRLHTDYSGLEHLFLLSSCIGPARLSSSGRRYTITENHVPSSSSLCCPRSNSFRTSRRFPADVAPSAAAATALSTSVPSLSSIPMPREAVRQPARIFLDHSEPADGASSATILLSYENPSAPLLK